MREKKCFLIKNKRVTNRRSFTCDLVSQVVVNESSARYKKNSKIKLIIVACEIIFYRNGKYFYFFPRSKKRAGKHQRGAANVSLWSWFNKRLFEQRFSSYSQKDTAFILHRASQSESVCGFCVYFVAREISENN